MLTDTCEIRLGRALKKRERNALIQRMSTLGAERLNRVVLQLSGQQLAAWLMDPHGV